ncbi:MAG: DUF2723 domain-containing protein [Myxococcales bacterium]|nr:DUF2723 domain-containing protein [Myxococcales bacterium]
MSVSPQPATESSGGHEGPSSDPIAWLVGAFVAATLIQGSAGGPSFLDSGELIAAARELGGIHPPGHPAWLSLSGLAELLPMGAYGARVVWLSALFAGLSAGLMVCIARRLMGQLAPTRAGALWSAAAGLALGCSASLWLVGSRAEVYTLALATNLWALEAALRAGDRASNPDDNRPIAGAAAEVVIAMALGLLNHHYIALLSLPVILVAAFPALRQLLMAPRRLGALIATGAIAGLGYLALPLRAVGDTEMRWGDPSTAQGFWHTVTARHFQRSVADAHVNIGDNAMVLLGTVSEGMGIWLAGAGLLGLGLAASRRNRTTAAIWMALVCGLLTKALMVIDTRNPDDHGYVLLAVAALALGLPLGARAVFGDDGLLRHAPAARRQWLSTLVVPWLLLFTGLGFAMRTTEPSTWLADQRGADIIDDDLRRALGPGAIYLSHYYGLQFNEAAWRIAEGRRPDVVTSHISFRTGDTDKGNAFARWFTERYPAEAQLAVAARRLKRAPIGNLLAMAESGRIYVEQDPDARIPATTMGFDGFAHRLRTQRERTLEYDLTGERSRRKRHWDNVYRRLGPPSALDHQTRAMMVWQHALQMAHALRRGWRAVARDELVRARAIAPTDRMLDRLEARLQLLDGAWKDGAAKRFHRLWHGYARLDLTGLAAPVGSSPVAAQKGD